MRVLAITQGSRGDIEPFSALAHELIKRGHEIALVGPASQLDLARHFGATCFPTIDPVPRLVADPEIRQSIQQGCHGPRGFRLRYRTMRVARVAMTPMLRDILEAACIYRPNIIVHHIKLPGNQIGEFLDVPSIPVCFDPSYIPTNSFPSPRFGLPAPRFLNRLTYVSAQYLIRGYISGVPQWRERDLGLRPRRGHLNVLRNPDGSPTVTFQAISKHILQHPLDYPGWVHTTGFWYAPQQESRSLPEDLVRFIDSGPPPVYIGFGSLSGTDPYRAGSEVREAVKRARVRAVVAAGWGGIRISDRDEQIYCITGAPHSALFPRMSAIVHHGGSGTTAAALASGRPQVVCPFYADQPYYASRMHQCGVAVKPLHQRSLNASGLSDAIRSVVDNLALERRAFELAERVRNEGGVAYSVDALESVVEHWKT
ncbi:glycosyltransferase [Haloechinothrix salitolerans]|uniref:Glycosyltransferase n=1 Tax=Haloechinothrix salitolerans TaxID=926830 RepID=A0ABW2C1N4_9PSEU